jgi:hypothetical protein
MCFVYFLLVCLLAVMELITQMQANHEQCCKKHKTSTNLAQSGEAKVEAAATKVAETKQVLADATGRFTMATELLDAARAELASMKRQLAEDQAAIDASTIAITGAADEIDTHLKKQQAALAAAQAAIGSLEMMKTAADAYNAKVPVTQEVQVVQVVAPVVAPVAPVVVPVVASVVVVPVVAPVVAPVVDGTCPWCYPSVAQIEEMVGTPGWRCSHCTRTVICVDCGVKQVVDSGEDHCGDCLPTRSVSSSSSKVVAKPDSENEDEDEDEAEGAPNTRWDPADGELSTSNSTPGCSDGSDADSESSDDDDSAPVQCDECTYDDQTKTVKCAGCNAQCEVERQLFVVGFNEIYEKRCQETGCLPKVAGVSEVDAYLQWTVTSYVGQDMNASVFAVDMTTAFDAAGMECPPMLVFLDVWEEQMNSIDHAGFSMTAYGGELVNPECVGSVVVWKGGMDLEGVVRYVGPHATKNIPCIGIALATPGGKSDGVVGIHQYCFAGVEANCFAVVNPARVQFVNPDGPKEVGSAKRKASEAKDGGGPAPSKKAKADGPCKHCGAEGHATKRSKVCAKYKPRRKPASGM